MRDNEIIKAFQYCFTNDFGKTNCYKCAFYTATAKCMDDMQNAVIDLINRQKAEIERLQSMCQTLSECRDEALRAGVKAVRNAKSEAIKEFAERLKCGGPQETGVIRCADVDNLVKEMTEVNENDRA